MIKAQMPSQLPPHHLHGPCPENREGGGDDAQSSEVASAS